MRFALLDHVRCSCGNEELRLERAIVKKTSESPGDMCRRFCGWKQRPVAASELTAADCAECRQQTIVEGNLACQCGLNWPIVNGVPVFSSSRPPETASGRIRIAETNPRTDPRWEPFVRAHPNGSAFHHPGWLQALEEEYGQRRQHLAAEDREGRLLGILPMFYTRGLPFNIAGNVTTTRLCSLPRTPAAGVLAVDEDAAASLLQAAVGYSRQGRAQLQVKTETPDLEILAPGLVATSWRPTYVTALPGDPEKLAFGNSAARHRLKWAVNKATKLGLEVREAETESELRAWYLLYLEVMRQNAVPARPYRFFRAIWELLRRDGVLRLILAERQVAGRRTLLAGSIILTLGGSACYAFTGGKKKDFTLHPNDLIQWRAIHDACRMGARRYDFGEVAEEHQRLVSFKSKWGAEPIAQFRYYAPAPPVSLDSARNSHARLRNAAASVWRRMPLEATGRIGDFIFSYL